MLYVPVEIKKSEIHGYGVFAAKDIQQGAVVWGFTPGMDRIISLYAVQAAEPRVRDFVMARGFVNPDDPENVVICFDESQFCNFPKPGLTANTEVGSVLDGQHLLLASEDILAGTEITVPPESDADYARKMESR